MMSWVPIYFSLFSLTFVFLEEWIASIIIILTGSVISVVTWFRLSIIWKSNLTDKMKRSFFQAAVVSILLYGCTTWTLTKRLEKKLDGNYTRMLRAIWNKSWKQHTTRRQLYGHLPPIRKTIQARRTRHAGHCWRSKDEIVSDVLLWTPTYGQSKAGRPARTYIQQLCDDTGCNPEDLPEAMNDRETWKERVRNIRASRTTWWWWWWLTFGWRQFLMAQVFLFMIQMLTWNIALIPNIVIWLLLPYLPTPPLGQDMTQGHPLSGVYQVFLLLD